MAVSDFFLSEYDEVDYAIRVRKPCVYNDDEGVAAPRDNVIFEAGYFMSAKGPDRSLIVRVGKAKMPADLGGAIYVYLDKGASVATIEGRLIDFLKKNL